MKIFNCKRRIATAEETKIKDDAYINEGFEISSDDSNKEDSHEEAFEEIGKA